MNQKGIIRKIDELGRIVIPKETRKMLRISPGDDFEILTDGDSIMLKKYSQIKSLSNIFFLIEATNKMVNGVLFLSDKEKIITNCEHYNKLLDDYLKNILINRLNYDANITDDKCFLSLKNCNYYILPIIVNSDAIGLLIVENNNQISKEDKKFVSLLKIIIENIMNL